MLGLIRRLPPPALLFLLFIIIRYPSRLPLAISFFPPLCCGTWYACVEASTRSLKDDVRTRTYQRDPKHLFEGKVVLDVGCGTG